MVPIISLKLTLGFALLAGGIAATASEVLLDVAFWRGLIIALVTGMLAAIGTIVGALISARISAAAARPIARDVKHIKEATAPDNPDGTREQPTA